jgi:hypothetical protein
VSADAEAAARRLEEARQHLANAASGHNLTWAVSKLLEAVALQEERLRALEQNATDPSEPG